jgi:hypothetical protein
MKFATTVTIFAAMASSATGFSRVPLEDLRRELAEEETHGGRHLKGSSSVAGHISSGSVSPPLTNHSSGSPSTNTTHPPFKHPSGSSSAAKSSGSVSHSNSTTTPPIIPPPLHCQIIPVFFFKKELRRNYSRNAIGGGFDSVPFYNTNTGAQLGYYSDEATNLASGDCVGTGVFSFGAVLQFQDQITFSFSCNGASNSITGGNGRFGCANGYEYFTVDNKQRVASVLTLCGDLCPHNATQVLSRPPTVP